MKNLAGNNKEKLFIMARKSPIVTTVKRKSRKIQSPTDYSIQFDDYLFHCEERNLTQGTVESYRFYVRLSEEVSGRKPTLIISR